VNLGDRIRGQAAWAQSLKELAYLAVHRRRRLAILHHPAGRRVAGAAVVADKAAGADDVAIAERLLTAYRAASSGEPARDPDIWTSIAERQQDFARLLSAGDAGRLAYYLCNVSRHDASEGITQGAAAYRRLSDVAPYRDFIARMARDKLVTLAEAVGALPPENPEQGAYGVNIERDLGEVVDRVSETIGISISPPDIDGGLFKIDTGRGFFGERDANAIYTAWLLTGLSPSSVCEIGGGSGRVAYWSHRLGLAPYSLIDLPRTNVVQGYYLLKTLPSVSLYGEPAPGDVTVLPDHAIAEPQPSFDIVLNQDSFPEIAREAVAGYLRWIGTHAERFVSINHESAPAGAARARQLNVHELLADAEGFELEQRWPYWLRKGYVVEVYRVRQPRMNA
jgi:hypothetical protein